MGCDFHLVSFLVYHLSSSINPSLPCWSVVAALSDLLWNPSLKFTRQISSRNLKTLHNGVKMPQSPSCLVGETRVQQLNNSRKVTEHVSPESSLDEKLGHVTLNLFAVSRLQLDLVEVDAYACTVKTFVGRKQCLIILLCFCFPFYFFFKIMSWASPTCVFILKSWLMLSVRAHNQRKGAPQCPHFLQNCYFPSVFFQVNIFYWGSHSCLNKEIKKKILGTWTLPSYWGFSSFYFSGLCVVFRALKGTALRALRNQRPMSTTYSKENDYTNFSKFPLWLGVCSWEESS